MPIETRNGKLALCHLRLSRVRRYAKASCEQQKSGLGLHEPAAAISAEEPFQPNHPAARDQRDDRERGRLVLSAMLAVSVMALVLGLALWVFSRG